MRLALFIPFEVPPLTRLLLSRAHKFHSIAYRVRLSLPTTNMSHGDPAKADDKAKLDAHFEKVAQTYEKDGMGVQNGMCRTLLALSKELQHPITKSSVVLDNAAGPGILTGELLKQISPSDVPELHAVDFSAAMIKVLDAKGWGEKYGVKAVVMDAQDLKYPNEMFTHVFMNLGIFALPDPLKGTKEIFRILKPSGITLVTTIRGVGWLPPFQIAQKRIKPDMPEFQGMLPPEWAKPEKIRTLLEEGGFEANSIEVREGGVSMTMAKFSSTQQGIAKMARDMIVKGWTDDETVAFDKALEEELKIEENSGILRSMGFWVGIAAK